MDKLTITRDTALGDIVSAYPETMAMFEALGIDYCCGGKRTLNEAADGISMPVERLQGVLNTTILQVSQTGGMVQNWQQAPLEEIIRHIQDTHHVFMGRQLPRVQELLDKVQRAHGKAHGAMLDELGRTYGQLREEIEGHLHKEDTVTFPAITRLIGGTCDSIIRTTISELTAEHDNAGAALEQMRAVTHGYQLPDDACVTFSALFDGLQAMERDLHAHVHLENNILFPRSLAMLEEVCAGR